MQTQRLYRDVARCRSFSEAARLHGITQSAASQRIGQLEKRLGVTLLDRSVRPLDLTDAGRTYLLGVGDVLERYDRLERSVIAQGSARPSARGRVRVAAIYSSGIDLLRRVGEGFAVDHPGIAVQIDYQKPDAVHESVTAGRADVGILSYPQRFKKVGVIPLRDEEMALVCPPGHALARRRGVDPAALHGVEMLGFDPYLPVARGTADYFKSHRSVPEVTHRFDNLDTLKSAVVATGRCAVLPTRTVRGEVAGGTLVAVPLKPRLVRPMGLIYRRAAAPGSGGSHTSGRAAAAGGQGASAAGPGAGAGGGELPLSAVASIFVDYLLQHARDSESTGQSPGAASTATAGESDPVPPPNPAPSRPAPPARSAADSRPASPKRAASASPRPAPAAAASTAPASKSAAQPRSRRPAVESSR